MKVGNSLMVGCPTTQQNQCRLYSNLGLWARAVISDFHAGRGIAPETSHSGNRAPEPENMCMQRESDADSLLL